MNGDHLWSSLLSRAHCGLIKLFYSTCVVCGTDSALFRGVPHRALLPGQRLVLPGCSPEAAESVHSANLANNRSDHHESLDRSGARSDGGRICEQSLPGLLARYEDAKLGDGPRSH